MAEDEPKQNATEGTCDARKCRDYIDTIDCCETSTCFRHLSTDRLYNRVPGFSNEEKGKVGKYDKRTRDDEEIRDI